MAPIRKGDGTKLASKGIAEVRKGDGTVLYSAAPDIPDSAIHQYLPPNFSASNWPDEIGAIDIDTISGAVFDSSAFNNSGGVFTDGIDDEMQSNGVSYIGGNLDSGWAFSYPFETDSTGDDQTFVSMEGGSELFARLDGVGFTSAPNISLQLRDVNGNALIEYTDNGYIDGSPHHLLVNVNGTSAGDIDFYVDDMSTPVASSNNRDQGLSTYADFSVGYYGSLGGGDYAELNHGEITWFNSTLNESERTAVDGALDWS